MFPRVSGVILLAIMGFLRFSVFAFTPTHFQAPGASHNFFKGFATFTTELSSSKSSSTTSSSLRMNAKQGNYHRRNYLATTGSFFLASGVASTFMQSNPALAEESKTPEGFETSPSGIQYKIVKEGTGGQATPGMMVQVHYSGWLDGFGDEGRKFDSSYDRRRPFSFKVGVGQVIGGWDESVLDMKVGEKRNVIIPPNLGYGARGAGGVIPPNATLYFTIEFLALK